MLNLIKKIVGTKNDREIKRIRPYVDEVNGLEQDYQGLSDAELKARTDQFKARLAEATASLKQELEEARAESASAEPERREEIKTQCEELDKQVREKEAEILEELLPEAFAAVREGIERGMRMTSRLLAFAKQQDLDTGLEDLNALLAHQEQAVGSFGG